ncbi:hypothetical protein [Streptomyces sp. NPDC017991]|uniref:hypothetical protein n=1 Tax=Streptomyces sp. NPDC017991 TaxID=3365026 RepID=UPI00379BD2AA
MRRLRLPFRRPRPAVLLAAGLAAAALGTIATFGPASAGATKATPQEIVTAFNDGFADGRADATGDDNRDGRIDEDESGWDCHTMGNRVCGAPIVPTECKGAGVAVGLCVTVASRPAYGWANPDGSRVDNPDGHAQIRDLDEKPGTPGFPSALRALDAEWREHH